MAEPDEAPAAAVAAALSLFARRLSHDLNNFATIIRSYSELLLSELSPGTTSYADAGEIHGAADAMVGYLRRVVRFSRVEAARGGRVAVEESVANVLSELQKEEEGAAAFLDGETSAIVIADPTAFGEAVREIVRNAREASPGDRLVRVHLLEERQSVDGASSVSSWVIVRVTDEGPGFADEIAATAEDPFVTTKTGVRGAGFGLTIAAAFARHGGGRLVRERDPALARTSVSIWLPAV